MSPPVGAARAGVVGSQTSDIPDSALYHYPILERSDSTIVEELSNKDATANGVTNSSGTWYEGYAEDGDGTDDYIAFPTAISDWIETAQNQWVAFTVNVDPSNLGTGDNPILGANDTAESPSELWIIGDFDGDGVLKWDYSGSDGDRQLVETGSAVLDGSKHRIVCQRTGVTASDMEIWVDGSEVSTSIAFEEGDGFNGSFSSTRMDPYAIARKSDGSASDFVQTAIDNALFGELGTILSASEIQDDYSNQPWS